MKVKGLILSVGVATLLSLTGCGGETAQKSDLEKESKSMLNQDNYINLAKYYYLQESRDRHAMKSRSMDHLNRTKSQSDANTIYVKANRTEDGTVKSMIIKNSGSLVAVSIDSEGVKVTLHGGTNEATQTLTLTEFRSFDIDETMIDEGEE